MVHSINLHDFLEKHKDTIFNLVKCYGFSSVMPIEKQVSPYEDFVTWIFYAVDKENLKEVRLRVRYYFSPAGRLLIDTIYSKDNMETYRRDKVDYIEGVVLD